MWTPPRAGEPLPGRFPPLTPWLPELLAAVGMMVVVVEEEATAGSSSFPPSCQVAPVPHPPDVAWTGSAHHNTEPGTDSLPLTWVLLPLS